VKWLYVLKNLHKLDRLPENLKEQVFEKVFDVAEIAKFSREEYMSYEDSLKYYRDLKNSLDTAKLEAKEEVVLNSIKMGLDSETISKITGLSVEQVERIRNH
jgi:predicted transposase/invertase (TIGR01784 family)